MKRTLLLLCCLAMSAMAFSQVKESGYQDVVSLKKDAQSTVTYKDLGDFKVFPNPTRNSLTVGIGRLNGGISFQISDILGKLVYSRKIVSHDLQQNSFKLDMSSFRDGIYMFSLKTKTASKTIKVVKL